NRRAAAGVALLVLACVACTDQPTAPPRVSTTTPNLSVAGDDDVAGVSDYLASVNRQAQARGIGVAAARAEALLSSDAPVKTPRIIFANDRELRLDSRWVPRDIRRLSTHE